MITNQERNEYLSDSGLQEEELRIIFAEMGIDYDAPEFEESIVEDVEKTARELGFAVNKVKQLNAAKPQDSSPSTEIVAQQIGEMMFHSLEEHGISLSPEAILALAQSKAEQYIELSDRIHLLAERVYAAREAHNEAQFVNKLINRSTQTASAVDVVLGDESQRLILESLTPQTRLNGEVDAFRMALNANRKAKAQLEQVREEQVKALPPKKVDINTVRAFLAARK